MALLHISDFHFGKDQSFDRSEVQRTFLEYCKGRAEEIEAILITGDVANKGKEEEYQPAIRFLEELRRDSDVDQNCIFICPGNHDVDRSAVKFHTRTLENQEQSDEFFSQDKIARIADGQNAFLQFFETATGRKFSSGSSIGEVRRLAIPNRELEIVSLNTAIFCNDDDDHGKLWVGRKPLSEAFNEAAKVSSRPIRIGLGHHPIDWLAEGEQNKVQALLEEHFDLYLRGHMHSATSVSKEGAVGSVSELAAGSMYQGAAFPISANFILFDDDSLIVEPIEYRDMPKPGWFRNLSFFPEPECDGRKVIRLQGISPTPPTLKDPLEGFFHESLLSAHHGQLLFVEPRICDQPMGWVSPIDSNVNELPLFDHLSKTKHVQIEVPLEFGGTVLSELCRHYVSQISQSKTILLKASEIPNYDKKLNEFLNSKFGDSKVSVVVDDVDHVNHRRTIRALVNSERVERIVAISGISGVSTIREIDHGRSLFDTSPIFLWSLDRKRIRSLALQIFNPKSEEEVSIAVDKTYSDLNAMAIPLTPANCIMYLHILLSEGNFVPLDRVSIIERYLNELLSRATDQTSTSFGVRDKVSFLSSFISKLFFEDKTFFVNSDWSKFCRAYMDETFVDFSADELLDQFLFSRVLVESAGKYYVRYAFIYEYLVGRSAAASEERLQKFLDASGHRKLPRTVDVISATASDPQPVVELLAKELAELLKRFDDRYLSTSHDPLAYAEWKIDNGEDDYWTGIRKQIEEGPAPSQAIDKVKESLLSETRSADQEVVIQDFEELEFEIFRASNALQACLRVVVGLNGEQKISALRQIFTTYLIVLQVATAFSARLAQVPFMQWGAITFVNESYDRDEVVEYDINEIVPWVIASIDRAGANLVCEHIGSTRLGGLFKAFRSKAPDPSEHELYLIFCLILRTKPSDWADELEAIIEITPYRKFRMNQYVSRLLYEFKNEICTVADKEKIKRLCAFVEAKRATHKAHPSPKIVTKIKEQMEQDGSFKSEGDENDETGPEH